MTDSDKNNRQETYLDQIRQANSRGIEITKWLLGSLLILNGGGLVGLMQIAGNGRTVPVHDGSIFVVGLICALVAGYFELGAATYDAAFWSDLAARNLGAPGAEFKFNPAHWSYRLSALAGIVGLVALVCFATAAMLVANDLATAKPSPLPSKIAQKH